MIQKAISLTMGSIILAMYLWSQSQPNDALFLFASANLAVNIVMVALAAALVRLSFMDKFKTLWGYQLTAVGAVVCLMIAASGIAFAGFDYKIYGVFGPLNFLILAQAGVLMSIAALSYQHQPYQWRLPSLNLQRLTLIRPSVRLPKLVFDSLKHAHIF